MHDTLKNHTIALVELLVVIDKRVIDRFEKIFKKDSNIKNAVEMYAENLIRRV
jgi:hypothetical protein